MVILKILFLIFSYTFIEKKYVGKIYRVLNTYLIKNFLKKGFFLKIRNIYSGYINI